MKPGDLVILSERDGSECFALGNHNPDFGGISIPDGSIALVVHIESPRSDHQDPDEIKVHVISNGMMGWVYHCDCETVSES